MVGKYHLFLVGKAWCFDSSENAKFANSPYFQCPSSLNSSSSSYGEASATSKIWQGTHKKRHWKISMFCNHVVMKCFFRVSEDNEQTQPKKSVPKWCKQVLYGFVSIFLGPFLNCNSRNRLQQTFGRLLAIFSTWNKDTPATNKLECEDP